MGLFDMDCFDDVRRMNKRQLFYQALNFGMIVSSALMIWKGLMVVTGSESPIVVVLSCLSQFQKFKIDGKLLSQLVIMRSEAPEFFYQCLEKRLNMDLTEILQFTRALDELGT